MTKDEFIAEVQTEFGSTLRAEYSSDQFTSAADQAARDTGWAYPVSGDFKISWQKQRMQRHLFAYMMYINARKFKFEQINLQHKFGNFKDLVKMLDEDFRRAMEENPTAFANTDAWEGFGHVADPGFAYEEQTGRDLSYDSDRLVKVTPGETE